METLDFNTRSGAESGIPDKIDDDDDDNVELEKSNVLLMGPTGSGLIITQQCSSVTSTENHWQPRHDLFISA